MEAALKTKRKHDFGVAPYAMSDDDDQWKLVAFVIAKPPPKATFIIVPTDRPNWFRILEV